MSRVLNSRHAVQALRKKTGAALDRDFVFLASEPAGVQDEWKQARSLTKGFLKLATMFEASSKDARTRMKPAQLLLMSYLLGMLAC